MNKEESKKARKVMEAWENGAEIEIRNRRQDFWFPIKGNISWLWDTIEYRIAKPKGVELEVGMELAIDGYRDAFRKVVYIHGDYVCYTFESALHTATMSGLCIDFNALINGKVYPILIKEPF
jgi:hypothetical protein